MPEPNRMLCLDVQSVGIAAHVPPGRATVCRQCVYWQGGEARAEEAQDERSYHQAQRVGKENKQAAGDRKQKEFEDKGARVEHVFGFCEQSMEGMYGKAVGFMRNAVFNALANLVYNMSRFEQIMRLGMN